MLDTTGLIVEAVGRYLTDQYRRVFGEGGPDHRPAIAAAARLGLERIALSDALYHDVEHTVMVTLVGTAILRGREIAERLTPGDWLHMTVALLCHDVGYVRGACRGDTATEVVVDLAGTRLPLPRGASDAWLTPFHVDRSKIFVRERAEVIGAVDPERVAAAIELTRFPVPDDGDHDATGTEAGLVRAADLIGQLADPAYPRKLAALYCEFRETGVAERLGYRDPADLAEQYPRFFWGKVEPHIGPALRHLERTPDGRLWVAQLYAHVFVEEHVRHRLGTERGRAAAGELRLVPGEAEPPVARRPMSG
jgi:hypothetical protein